MKKLVLLLLLLAVWISPVMAGDLEDRLADWKEKIPKLSKEMYDLMDEASEKLYDMYKKIGAKKPRKQVDMLVDAYKEFKYLKKKNLDAISQEKFDSDFIPSLEAQNRSFGKCKTNLERLLKHISKVEQISDDRDSVRKTLDLFEPVKKSFETYTGYAENWLE